MVCEFGMSEKIGPINYKERSNEQFTKPFSEKTSEEIDSEIKRIINDAEKTAEKVLRDNIDILHKMSEELMKRETLISEEIDKIINGEELPEFVKKVKRTDKERLRELEKIKNKAKKKDVKEDDEGLEGNEVPAT